jgi:hypothetical protein
MAQIVWLLIFAVAVYVLVMRVRATLHDSRIGPLDAAMQVIFESAFFVVAGLMIWRKADDRMGLFTAFCLLLFGGVAASSDPKIPAEVPPLLASLGNALAVVGNISLFLFFYLFPDGRLVRPWLLALLVPGVVLQNVGGSGPPPTPVGDLIGGLVILLPFAVIIYIQVYRYRRISTPAQRQQTKWIVYGLAVGFLGFLATAALGNVPGPAVRASILYQVVESFLLYGFLMLVPLAIGLAILRYRLYEVDLLINRTLVYGSLTVSLAALYIGGVVGLEAVFHAITGQRSELVIAAVTLAVAGLFNPWRHQLQRFIDRRFYRHKYDAARVLSAFTTHLRDEVDLDELSGDLMTVVQETVQPATVSLWLKAVS